MARTTNKQTDLKRLVSKVISERELVGGKFYREDTCRCYWSDGSQNSVMCEGEGDGHKCGTLTEGTVCEACCNAHGMTAYDPTTIEFSNYEISEIDDEIMESDLRRITKRVITEGKFRDWFFKHFPGGLFGCKGPWWDNCGDGMIQGGGDPNDPRAFNQFMSKVSWPSDFGPRPKNMAQLRKFKEGGDTEMARQKMKQRRNEDVRRLKNRVLSENFEISGDEPATKSDLNNAVNYIIKTLRDEISIGSYGDFIKEGSLNEWAPGDPSLPHVEFDDYAAHSIDTTIQGPTNVTQSMINDCEHHLQNIPSGNNLWIQSTISMVMGKSCSFLETKYGQLYDQLQSLTGGTSQYARKQARLFFVECLWAKCSG